MPRKSELEQLLPIIIKWANQEEWFKKELVRIFKEENNNSSTSLIEEKITNIEKYLLLNGTHNIDYKLINNPHVRDQLIRDSYEMSRYRVGLIKHDIQFEEFCRYAHMQCEELLNYFFLERHNKRLSNIIDEIKNFNEKALIKDPRSISEIGYTIKLVALYKMQVITPEVYQTCWKLNEIRNNISHRNTSDKKVLNTDTLKFFTESNYDHVYSMLMRFLDGVINNINVEIKKSEKATVFSQNETLKNIAQKLS